MSVVTARFHEREFSLVDIGGRQCDLIREGAIYEPALLEWVYAQNFSGLAYDVGANIGNHTLWFSEICEMKVFAFEPVEHEKLITNVNLNWAGSRVRVFNYALGDTDTWAQEVGRCTLAVTNEGSIPVRRMDSFEVPEGESLTLVKVDVEGMETAVIRGGMATIDQHRPVILTEEWEESTTRDIGKLLKPLGYVRERSFGGRGRAPVGAWRCA